MEEERKLYLPYLVSALAEASFQGALGLMEGDVQRTILFNAGKPVNVLSRLQEETLGRILLDEGKISTEDYNRMLDLMVQTGQHAGEVLISMGLLGPQDVFSALEFQTRKKLLNCFKMEDFGFSLEEKPVPPEQLISRLEPTEIIFLGIQTGFTVDRLLNEFPVDEETIFSTRKPPKNFQPRMGPRENKVFRSIGSGNTLVKLMGKEGDLQHLLAILYALHALKMIEASDVVRPSTRDLELPGLEEEPAVEAPVSAAPAEAPKSRRPEAVGRARAPSLEETIQGGKVDPALAEKVLSLAGGDHFSILEIGREVKGLALEDAFNRLVDKFKLRDIEQAYSNAKEQEMAGRLLDRATIAYRELADPEACKAYLKAMKKDKDLEARKVSPRVLADVEAQKGELALSGKRYQEATELFDKAIKLYPQEPSYHFQMGLAAYSKAMDETAPEENLPESVKHPFLKAMAMNPRYDMPRLYLGYFSKRNGDLRRALKEFEGALECNPQNTRAQAEVRFAKKRLEDSELPKK
jgi:tetratricopeptide (TPR) repeat protein